MDILLTQSQIAIKQLTETNIENLLSPKQLLVWQYLEKNEEVTPMDISKKTGVTRSTVTQVLVKLLDLKMVEKIGLGSTTRYRRLK